MKHSKNLELEISDNRDSSECGDCAIACHVESEFFMSFCNFKKMREKSARKNVHQQDVGDQVLINAWNVKTSF